MVEDSVTFEIYLLSVCFFCFGVINMAKLKCIHVCGLLDFFFFSLIMHLSLISGSRDEGSA